MKMPAVLAGIFVFCSKGIEMTFIRALAGACAAALWSVQWGLAVPANCAIRDTDIAAYADQAWIVNSRNTADEDAVRTLASLAGFVPRIAHEIDSLELVEDLIIAGYGVGLLPIGRVTTAGVKVLPLSAPRAVLTAYAVTRRGRTTWPPLRTALDRMRPPPGRALPRPNWPRPVPAT